MMAYIEAQAKIWQCDYIILVSSGFRHDAHRFYEAVGYTEDVRGFRKCLLSLAYCSKLSVNNVPTPHL